MVIQITESQERNEIKMLCEENIHVWLTFGFSLESTYYHWINVSFNEINQENSRELGWLRKYDLQWQGNIDSTLS
jgi:hypothetical protein